MDTVEIEIASLKRKNALLRKDVRVLQKEMKAVKETHSYEIANIWHSLRGLRHGQDIGP
jgi:hypothetical protein